MTNMMKQSMKRRRQFMQRCLRVQTLEDRRLLAGPHAPAAGQTGSTAIPVDDVSIVGWATGFQDYVAGTNVDEEFQTPEKSLGPAEGTVEDVVSLGRGGEITLTFDHPIRDGLGADFAVFENAFADTFLELGFVEVSSDGSTFFRFANESLTPAPVEAFGVVDPTEVHNLAGKYRQGFGTPFDLAELAETPGLDIDQITHVKLIDVVGDGTQFDTGGNAIYDPFPTVGSAGLDVDGVAVLNQAEIFREVIGFEDVGVGLSAESAFSGPVAGGENVIGPFGDNVVVGTFESETLVFNNAFSTDFGSWNGWAYSNAINTTTAGFENQFSSFAGGGADDSSTFGIAFPDQGGFFEAPTIARPENDERRFESLLVTNTTYAALSMERGDSFAKKFGGTSGDDPDFLLLTITGKDADDATVGTIDFYLADYRFADNSLDYIVDQWERIDLSSLALAEELQFAISSSDVGPFGINTPAYVAVDQITLSTPALSIDFVTSEISEAAGSTTVRVSRPVQEAGAALAVSLSPVDSTIATVPTTVTIPDGQAFVDFPIALIDNDRAGENTSLSLQASAEGFVSGQRTVLIGDDDVRTLSLEVSVPSVDEGQSLVGTVSRNDADLSSPLTVQIQSESALLSFDQSVTIPADAASGTFSILALEDSTDRSNATVSLAADGDGYLSGDVSFDVIDNDQPTVLIEAQASYSEAQANPHAGFEDVGVRLLEESFYNGSDLAGGFVSGDLNFNNDFNVDFGSWAGWSYSNTTDVTTPGFGNQYSSFVGEGANGSATYAIAAAFVTPTITRADDTTGFESIQITNSTYAALSMMQGDDFAKRFGGESGDDPDFFLLTIDGLDASGDSIGTVEFYLADYRFTDNSQDYIVDQWTTIDLSSISQATELAFSLSSSDVGSFGMNTPAYVAVDNVKLVNEAAPTIEVRRNTDDLSADLNVVLSSDDVDTANLPSSVTIPAGQAGVFVPLTIVDDLLVDGTQTALFTASAEGHVSSSASVEILDDDIQEIRFSLLSDAISESDGEGRGVLYRNSGDLSQPLQVSISVDLENQLLVDDLISIPAGSRSVEVAFSAIDNDLVDQDRQVVITAAAEGLSAVDATLLIENDDLPPPTLVVQIDRATLSEADSPVMVTLEDIGATIADESFYNGADLAGGFTSGDLNFNNSFNPDFGSWAGWSVSNTTDTVTPGFLNQYSAFPGSGANESASYAVASAFAGGTLPTLTVAQEDQTFESLMISNTTYAALSMRDGDAFAKKFGGESGDDEDFFLLTIEGFDSSDQSVGTIDFYLADFRFADNSLDYILDDWTTVDVSGLVGARRLQFSLSSSDVGDFGMNTPAYFAADQVRLSGGDIVAAVGTVTRSDAELTDPLVVELGADSTELLVPRTVTIPADQASATFSITPINDAIVDGGQLVEVTAFASTHTSGSGAIMVEDDDVPTVTLSVSSASISEENDSNDLVVHRNTDDAVDLLVDLLAEEGVQVPSQITIPSGARSAVVTLSGVDDSLLQGSRTVAIEGSASGFNVQPIDVVVTDNEVAEIVVTQTDGNTSLGELLGEDQLSVSLAAMPASDVFVVVEATSEDVLFDISRVAFTPSNWDQPQLVTVIGVPDLRQNDESVDVRLTVDTTASEPLFAPALDIVVVAAVSDYQPELVRLQPDGTDAVLVEVSSGIEFQRSSAAGITVQGNDLTQGILLDDLDQVANPVHVDAAGGDDSVSLFGATFTSIEGGEGFDRLTLAMDGAIELVSLLRDRVSGFEEINLSNDIDLSIETSQLDAIAMELLIRLTQDQEIEFLGNGVQLDPVLIGVEVAQAIQFGDVTVHVLNQQPWKNALNKFDVNQSGDVSSMDALAIVNQLARIENPELPVLDDPSRFTGLFYDVSGDNRISALDALRVINELNRQVMPTESEDLPIRDLELDRLEFGDIEQSSIVWNPRKIMDASTAFDAAIQEFDFSDVESPSQEGYSDPESIDALMLSLSDLPTR